VGEQIALNIIIVSTTIAGALRETNGSTSAARWLAIALIVWLAGALAGFASLPKRQSVRSWTTKPPAHRPVGMESPSDHWFPPVACLSTEGHESQRPNS
jgi:hypothetical protein